jgi:hypothetical protein
MNMDCGLEEETIQKRENREEEMEGMTQIGDKELLK